jgi:hypothetical protein
VSFQVKKIKLHYKYKILYNKEWVTKQKVFGLFFSNTRSYLKHSFQTRSGPRPGFRVLTGRPGQFFLKSKWRRFSKKKKTKVNMLQPGFWPGQPARSHRVFLSLIFSLTRSDSSPGSARSRVDPPGRAEFQNYDLKCCLNYYWHSKNKILVLLLNGITMKILIVKQLFLKELFGHLGL